MRNYLIIIERGERNFSAFSPDVPGCGATGKTIEDVLVNIKEALEFHLESLDEEPEPKGLRYYLDSGELEFEPGSLFTELEAEPRIAA